MQLEVRADAGVQPAAPELNETPEAATPDQEASAPLDGALDAPAEVETLDAREEPIPCVTGTYKCVGQLALYCSNGTWNDTIDCPESMVCVADSRSCVP
jgi:hypothetical protein